MTEELWAGYVILALGLLAGVARSRRCRVCGRRFLPRCHHW